MSLLDVSSSLRWVQGSEPIAFAPADLCAAIARVRETVHIVRGSEPAHHNGAIGLASGGHISTNQHESNTLLLASLPPLYPEWLGDRGFTEVHGLRFPYVGGAMANGITSPQMVIALGRAGMLGMLGTAGLSLNAMAERLAVVAAELGGSDTEPARAWGANLIHSPQEPAMEMQTVELFLACNVRRLSASAFMGLTPAIVRYAATGLYVDASGNVQRQNHVFAKISRPEVAARFMTPPPAAMLNELVAQGFLTAHEAELASTLPVAEDITVESDSGGHTDNRPLGALFPTVARLRDDLVAAHGFTRPIRLGAAGGLGTPQAVAAAFALGAAYVLTGSINQASVEAAQSDAVKQMLAVADMADVMMAPAGDMFELGVDVQVLKRGTMFGVRARRLYEIYTQFGSIEAIPADVKERLERDIFGQTMESVWQETREFFSSRNPAEVQRGDHDARHRLALVCRWYLGLSSRWAINGVPERRLDYQVWVGPAQGAFNAWAKNSFLEPVANRSVVQMALNLLEGAAVVTRAAQCRSYGIAVPAAAFDFKPRPLA